MKQDTPTPLRNSLIKDVIHVYTLGAHHVLVKILGIPLVLLGGASFLLVSEVRTSYPFGIAA